MSANTVSHRTTSLMSTAEKGRGSNELTWCGSELCTSELLGVSVVKSLRSWGQPETPVMAHGTTSCQSVTTRQECHSPHVLRPSRKPVAALNELTVVSMFCWSRSFHVFKSHEFPSVAKIHVISIDRTIFARDNDAHSIDIVRAHAQTAIRYLMSKQGPCYFFW